jgi:hypothetical protein
VGAVHLVGLAGFVDAEVVFWGDSGCRHLVGLAGFVNRKLFFWWD